MPFVLLTGTFMPNGDTARFRPDNPSPLFTLTPQGCPPRINDNNGTVAFRYEAIDALDKDAKEPFASIATKKSLALLGLSAPADEARGYILTRLIDSDGRPVSWVFTGTPPVEDGTSLFLDVDQMRTSVNFQLLQDLLKVQGRQLADALTRENLLQALRDRELEIRTYLNSLGEKRGQNLLDRMMYWFAPDDPVRTKNFEKIAGYLHTIQFYLASRTNDATVGEQATLTVLLEELTNPRGLLWQSVWELADQLEIETIRYLDHDSIKLLVCRTLGISTKSDWAADPHVNEKMQHNPRQFLIDDRLALIAEYRRDRAKAELRGTYLMRMTPVLLLALLGVCVTYLYTTPSLALPVVLLAMFAGAMGSVLSYAVKIGKGTDTQTKGNPVPLGIRALTLTRKLFIAQPVVGATAGLIISLIFASGLQQVQAKVELEPSTYAVLAFIAGFSEPFFLGVVDKVAGVLAA